MEEKVEEYNEKQTSSLTNSLSDTLEFLGETEKQFCQKIDDGLEELLPKREEDNIHLKNFKTKKKKQIRI